MNRVQLLRDSLATGARDALLVYASEEIAELHSELEGASLARVRHIQGRIAALRALAEVFNAGEGRAQPAQQPNGGYTV